MSPTELIFRILLALIFPPFGIIGMGKCGCGAFALLFLLTVLFYVPGQIAAVVLIAQEYSKTNP